MFCSQCGTQLAANSIYCSSCGNKMENQATPPPPENRDVRVDRDNRDKDPNPAIDKNKLKNSLFLAMFMDGLVLFIAIGSEVASNMVFSTLFLGSIVYAYKSLQANNYSGARTGCFIGAILNGVFALSNFGNYGMSSLVLFEGLAASNLIYVYGSIGKPKS